MINLLLKFLFFVIVTEAITDIVVKSFLFNPLKKKLFNLSYSSRLFYYVHYLFDCGFCFSVWVGTILGFLFFREEFFLSIYIDWFFIGLVLHKMSNVLHDLLHRLFDSRLETDL